MVIATTVENKKQKNQTVSALCMDVKIAFDNIYLELLINSLIDKDLPLPVQKWVRSFISNQLTK